MDKPVKRIKKNTGVRQTVLRLTFSFLSPLELSRCSSVSKHWYTCSLHPELWKGFIYQVKALLPNCTKAACYPSDDELDTTNWKDLFRFHFCSLHKLVVGLGIGPSSLEKANVISSIREAFKDVRLAPDEISLTQGKDSGDGEKGRRIEGVKG